MLYFLYFIALLLQAIYVDLSHQNDTQINPGQTKVKLMDNKSEYVPNSEYVHIKQCIYDGIIDENHDGSDIKDIYNKLIDKIGIRVVWNKLYDIYLGLFYDYNLRVWKN